MIENHKNIFIRSILRDFLCSGKGRQKKLMTELNKDSLSADSKFLSLLD